MSAIYLLKKLKKKKMSIASLSKHLNISSCDLTSFFKGDIELDLDKLEIIARVLDEKIDDVISCARGMKKKKNKD